MKKFSDYQIVSIIDTEYSAIEQYIERVFGIPYEIVAGEEVNRRGVSITVTVDGQLTSHEQNKLEEWKGGVNTMYALKPILNFMASLDLVPKGNWVIEVDW